MHNTIGIHTLVTGFHTTDSYDFLPLLFNTRTEKNEKWNVYAVFNKTILLGGDEFEKNH